MTEEEWLAAADPRAMLVSQRPDWSDRKLRLLALAFARRASRYFPSLDLESLLSETARACEGLLSEAEASALLERVWDIRAVAGADAVLYSAWHVFMGLAQYAPLYSAQNAAHELANARLEELAATNPDVYALGVPVDECEIECQLIRCVFGNPFRPVAFDPAWRTSDVVALARGIYDERAFDRMPILADALQDAGCTSDDILNHCRDTATPHARGCWVVDLVLGKA